MALDTALLNSIESEIRENKVEIFEKTIPIDHYSFETKRTLDFIIEKYGGYIKRYNDKIIAFIKPTSTIVPESNTLTFDSINNSLNNLDKRLTTVENKLTAVFEKNNTNNKNLESYLQYFRSIEEKKEIHKLIAEILNHNM
jgi:hypothetical protein